MRNSNVATGVHKQGRAQDSSGAAIDPGLARDLSELARALGSQDQTQAVMQLIVDAVPQEIETATGASITC